MASGTTFPPVPTLMACLGGAVLLFHSIYWQETQDPFCVAQPDSCCSSLLAQSRAPHACTFCASCCDSDCPVCHQSPAATSFIVPLMMPSSHRSWTASQLTGKGMGLLRTAGTAAQELHPHCAPLPFFMPTCPSICTWHNLPITHAGVWAHILRNRLHLYSLLLQRTLHL